MWNEFKKFAMKGNVIDLAVGVVIGAAFGKIVTSLVEDLIMPLVGLLIGGLDFTKFAVTIGEAEVKYGLFIQNIVNFLIIAFSIFLVVRFINRMKRKEEVQEEAPKIDTKEELLKEIRDLLREK
ncbi:large conductance mechanosensitive channel protein MscL [Robertmurraya massiliosenegalensis]|uniref:large conductance mechanosensitive channel protein MscL n=1 Tax=Robertmurraya TaxID=2837507 RepID=UPI0039A4B7D3